MRSGLVAPNCGSRKNFLSCHPSVMAIHLQSSHPTTVSNPDEMAQDLITPSETDVLWDIR
jgi:hypothetical protein